MSDPVDLRVVPEPPARLFTVEDANRLVPALDRIFGSMDAHLLRLREIRDLLEDHEVYWGRELHEASNPERQDYVRLVAELNEVRNTLDAGSDEIRSIGCELKDPALGLVDFYAIKDGELVYLCWRRGEPKVANWHTLEGGFAARKPIRRGTRAEL